MSAGLENTESISRTFSDIPSLAAAINSIRDHIPDRGPFLSILTPLWNTRPEWIEQLADSILSQTFLDWEWCLVDDASESREFYSVLGRLQALPNITVNRFEERQGISAATNKALAAATGEFVCCVDHDDVLTLDALRRCSALLSKGFDAVYTDSDKISEDGLRYEPFHKPDWSPEYFRGVMYVGHLLCVRKSIAQEIGGFDSRFNGIQDYEFFLRFSERTSKIAHVAEILYHWRSVPGSVATTSGAKGNLTLLQTKAVQEHLMRLRLDAMAGPGTFPDRVRVIPGARRTHPRISVIIPTKNSPAVLAKCLRSIYSKTTYPNLQVVCVDNETQDPAAIQELCISPVDRVLYPGRFNYSRANNLALKYTDGEYLVLMNNDIEVISLDWLEQMLFYAEQEDVGAVGPLLLYPNGSVQHAGVVLGTRGTADHVLRFCPGDCDGYAGSLSCAREVSAVTAACLMIRRSVYISLNGLSEHYFTHYQDVDLCLKIRATGKRIIFTPHATLIHHESASRGQYYDLVDRNLLLDSWASVITKGDPYYNKHFDLNACNYSLPPPGTSR